MTGGCATCGVPVPGTKPPPIVLNVAAIEEVPITLGGAQEIDWMRVAGLPPFQMFLGERGYLDASGIAELAGPPGDAKKQAFLQLRGRLPAGPEGLWDDYRSWHEAKGYWPNETPMGEVKEG